MKALISVFNKDNIVEFATALQELGIEILATEGTARVIAGHGISVTKVSAFTGVPELLDGKVKTLHPRIHAAIATAEIELVVVNLIPTAQTSEKTLDNMDIGGVALLRSGIKNYVHVAVIVDPSRYKVIADELRANRHTSRETKLRLAQEASAYVLAYESTINAILERIE